MSDCCSSSVCQTNKKHHCPVNGKNYSEVSLNTILKHIKKPWNRNLIEQKYYFCDDPECDVIYFGKGNTVFKQSNLKTKVGISLVLGLKLMAKNILLLMIPIFWKCQNV